MKTSIYDLLQFIDSYRAMENGKKTNNKSLLKEVVPARKFDHLLSSWLGRENDFGSFFLNLEYKLQGKFLQYWGVELTDFNSFITELERTPIAYISTVPPVEILEIHEMMLFFNNHGIDKSSIPSFSFPKHPNESEQRYGNSKNWGNYVHSLNREAQVSFFIELAKIIDERVEKRINDINSYKSLTLK